MILTINGEQVALKKGASIEYGSENQPHIHKKKANKQIRLLAFSVGMTRFELATPRPPDAYSNRTELHPELCFSRGKSPIFFEKRCKINTS